MLRNVQQNAQRYLPHGIPQIRLKICVYPHISVILLFKKFFLIFLFIFEGEWDTQSMSRGGAVREGDREFEAGSRL